MLTNESNQKQQTKHNSVDMSGLEGSRIAGPAYTPAAAGVFSFTPLQGKFLCLEHSPLSLFSLFLSVSL